MLIKQNKSIVNLIINPVLLIFAFIAILAVSGCAREDEELTAYKESMQAFNDRIQNLVSDIDSIDLDSEDKGQILLECLDEMDTAFAEMAALPVPQQFENISDLADEASANLSRAVSLYHQAFDTPTGYDPSLIQAAQEYYSRAFRRISYIGTIMQGKIPQDEHVTIVHEDDEEEGEEDTN